LMWWLRALPITRPGISVDRALTSYSLKSAGTDIVCLLLRVTLERCMLKEVRLLVKQQERPACRPFLLFMPVSSPGGVAVGEESVRDELRRLPSRYVVPLEEARCLS